MGQPISYCKTGTDASIGSFEPHVGEFLDTVSKPSFSWNNSNVNNNNNDEATASTGLSSSKTSISPGCSSSDTTDKDNDDTSIPATSSNLPPITTNNHIHNPIALRYTTSTRNLQNPTKEAVATTATTSIPSVQSYRSRVDSYPQQSQKRGKHGSYNHSGKIKPILLRRSAGSKDKRSNPVKFPRKRQTYGLSKTREKRNSASANPDASSHSHDNPQQTSYLERMYDSRTWEMYRRITTHREKVEAFNATNPAAKQQQHEEKNDEDRNYSANQTYMSDPVQRVTNSSTMEGGVDYDNFYDPAMDDDDTSSRDMGDAFLLEDHSAPPYHHHRQYDNGQHHYHNGGAYHHQYGGQCNNSAETYSEWEHMYGDDVEIEGTHSNDATNAHGGHHETIFLFDF